MLIESPFRDYYDHAAAHGVDTTIRYKRVTSWWQTGDANSIGLPPLPHKHPLVRRGHTLGNTSRHLSKTDQAKGLSFREEANPQPCFVSGRRSAQICIRARYLGFCGKLYPFAAYGRFDKLYYAFSLADLTSSIYSNPDLAETPSWELWNQHFARGVLETDVPFERCASPVLLMHSPGQSDSIETEINPCLRYMGFQSVVSDFEAWTKIEAYLTNVLRVGIREIVEISDKDKVHKAGFDVKTSFRKGKG